MRRALWVAFIVLGAVGMPVSATAGPAATVVDTFVDEVDGSCADGDCSLRDAIATTAPGGEVSLPSGFYQLTIEGPGGIAAGDLDVSSALTIRADGDTGAFVSAAPGDRVVQVHGGLVRIEGVSLFGGNVVRPGEPGGIGGAVDLIGGTLSLDRVTITGGRAHAGGGIAVRGSGRLRLIDSVVLDNAATHHGGGASLRGSAVIEGTSFSMNHTAGRGGGLFASDVSVVSLTDSTVARNRALVGGGLMVEGVATIASVTIAYNEASSRGGGYAGEAAHTSSVEVRSTIVAGNGARDRLDCKGAMQSLGHNVSHRSGCGFDHATDLRGVDPRLGAFDAHGGPSPTVVLMAMSPAIDLRGACGTRDQRGAPRDERCDAGAYERVLCLGRSVNIVGTPGDDELSGGLEPDAFLGLTGADEFQGSLNDDVACGGAGDDHLIGGPGHDDLAGGHGRDELDGEEGFDRCRGGPGTDELIACEA